MPTKVPLRESLALAFVLIAVIVCERPEGQSVLLSDSLPSSAVPFPPSNVRFDTDSLQLRWDSPLNSRNSTSYEAKCSPSNSAGDIHELIDRGPALAWNLFETCMGLERIRPLTPFQNVTCYLRSKIPAGQSNVVNHSFLYRTTNTVTQQTKAFEELRSRAEFFSVLPYPLYTLAVERTKRLTIPCGALYRVTSDNGWQIQWPRNVTSVIWYWRNHSNSRYIKVEPSLPGSPSVNTRIVQVRTEHGHFHQQVSELVFRSDDLPKADGIEFSCTVVASDFTKEVQNSVDREVTLELGGTTVLVEKNPAIIRNVSFDSDYRELVWRASLVKGPKQWFDVQCFAKNASKDSKAEVVDVRDIDYTEVFGMIAAKVDHIQGLQLERAYICQVRQNSVFGAGPFSPATDVLIRAVNKPQIYPENPFHGAKHLTVASHGLVGLKCTNLIWVQTLNFSVFWHVTIHNRGLSGTVETVQLGGEANGQEDSKHKDIISTYSLSFRRRISLLRIQFSRTSTQRTIDVECIARAGLFERKSAAVRVDIKPIAGSTSPKLIVPRMDSILVGDNFTLTCKVADSALVVLPHGIRFTVNHKPARQYDSVKRLDLNTLVAIFAFARYSDNGKWSCEVNYNGLSTWARSPKATMVVVRPQVLLDGAPEDVKHLYHPGQQFNLSCTAYWPLDGKRNFTISWASCTSAALSSCQTVIPFDKKLSIKTSITLCDEARQFAEQTPVLKLTSTASQLTVQPFSEVTFACFALPYSANPTLLPGPLLQHKMFRISSTNEPLCRFADLQIPAGVRLYPSRLSYAHDSQLHIACPNRCLEVPDHLYCSRNQADDGAHWNFNMPICADLTPKVISPSTNHIVQASGFELLVELKQKSEVFPSQVTADDINVAEVHRNGLTWLHSSGFSVVPQRNATSSQEIYRLTVVPSPGPSPRELIVRVTYIIHGRRVGREQSFFVLVAQEPGCSRDYFTDRFHTHVALSSEKEVYMNYESTTVTGCLGPFYMTVNNVTGNCTLNHQTGWFYWRYNTDVDLNLVCLPLQPHFTFTSYLVFYSQAFYANVFTFRIDGNPTNVSFVKIVQGNILTMPASRWRSASRGNRAIGQLSSVRNELFDLTFENVSERDNGTYAIQAMYLLPQNTYMSSQFTLRVSPVCDVGLVKIGNVCKPDFDDDGLPDSSDPCPRIYDRTGSLLTCCSSYPRGCSFDWDSVWNISWANTPAGSTTHQPCPKRFHLHGVATRFCRWNSSWARPDLSGCHRTVLKNLAANAIKKKNCSLKQSEKFASDLMKHTDSNKFYPGDISNSLKLLGSLITHQNNRLDGNQAEVSSSSYRSNFLKSVSNLLDSGKVRAWEDVRSSNDFSNDLEMLVTLTDEFAVAEARGSWLSENDAVVGERCYQGTTQMDVLILPPYKESSFEEYGQKISKQNLTVNGKGTSEQFVSFSDNALKFGSTFQSNASSSIHGTSISLPSEIIFNNPKGVRVSATFLFVPAFSKLGTVLANATSASLSGRKWAINTLFASISLVDSKKRAISTSSLESPIAIEFEHLTPLAGRQVVCAFWNVTSKQWSREGVTDDSANKNRNRTTCYSTHLTSFSVLVASNDVNSLSSTDKLALKSITYVGSAISLALLLLTIMIFASFKQLHTEMIMIHLNLALTLAIAQTIFLAGIERTESVGLCRTVAIVLHFFFLSALCWMLVEGLHIYIQLVKVFTHGSSRLCKYYAIGYLLPVLIVVVSAVVRFSDYGTHTHCWINSNSSTLLVFNAPIVLVISFNACVLGRIMRLLYKRSSRKGSSRLESARSGLKAAVVLAPCMGLSWVFGLLAVNENTLVFHYLFVICNSLQGACIFFLQCCCNTQVKAAIKNWWQRRQSDRRVFETPTGRTISSVSVDPVSGSPLSSEQLHLHSIATRVHMLSIYDDGLTSVSGSVEKVEKTGMTSL